MGSSASKKVVDKASLSKVIDHPVQTSDVSTGFHILEIHMPSVGMGWLSILLFVLGALAIYAIWRRFRHQGHPRQRHGYPYPAGPSPFVDGPWDRLPRDFVPHPIDTGRGRWDARFDEDRFQDLTLARDRVRYVAATPSSVPCPALQSAVTVPQMLAQPDSAATPASTTATC